MVAHFDAPAGRVEACGDEGDLYVVAHFGIDHCTEDYVGFRVGVLLDDGGGFIHFEDTQVGAARDIEEYALRAFDADFEER